VRLAIVFVVQDGGDETLENGDVQNAEGEARWRLRARETS
jgi:hypothetical protein